MQAEQPVIGAVGCSAAFSVSAVASLAMGVCAT